MEYKALSQLPETSAIADADLFLASREDARLGRYQSFGVKWRDVRKRFAQQIGEGTGDPFRIPVLSALSAATENLSVLGGLYLSPQAISAQVSAALGYDADGFRLTLRNADGSVSSSVGVTDILGDFARRQMLSSVQLTPDASTVVLTLVDRAQAGGGAVRNIIGVPLSAKNALYSFADGVKVLTSDLPGSAPSVVVDYEAVYAALASNSASAMAIPMLSTPGLSAFGGFLSGTVLREVSAESLSAGGYDVGDTLCSLVSGLSAANDKIRRTLSTHVASFDLGYGVMSALSDILSTETLSSIEWEDGDVLVVRKKVCEDPFVGSPYQHTAYVYAGPEATPEWHAMDGTYSADSVVFGEDIELAGAYTSVGNIKISDGVLGAKGKTVKQLFDQIFDKTIQPEVGSLPQIQNFKLIFSNPEVGRSGYVYYQLDCRSGSYVQPWGEGSSVPTSAEINVTVAQDGGTITHSWDGAADLTSFNGQLLQEITFRDDTVVSAAVSAVYGQGKPATDNKGQITEVVSPSGQIEAVRSNVIKGYRKYFWGAHQQYADDISCDNIDSLLSSSSTKAAEAGDSFVISIKPGDKRVAFAYPAAGGLGCRVTDDTSHQDATSAFQRTTVQIGGYIRCDANTMADYNLFQTLINVGGEGAAAANTYTVTFTN